MLISATHLDFEQLFLQNYLFCLIHQGLILNVGTCVRLRWNFDCFSAIQCNPDGAKIPETAKISEDPR